MVAADKSDLEFLEFLMHKKRLSVLSVYQSNVPVIDADKIVKRNPKELEPSVQPKEWLEIIDYCLIRIYMKQREFKILFDFLN